MNYEGTKLCAVADHVGSVDCMWPIEVARKGVLIHASGMIGQVSIAEACEQAIQGWNRVCGIRLVMATNPQTAHIVVAKGSIDGPAGTLAWSELPCGFTPSMMRTLQQKYDTGEMWVVGENPPPDRIDLVRVMCHEIGHAIGLGHIGAGNLLAPTYSGSIRWPMNGDIVEARARYGAPQQPTPAPAPTPKPAPTPGPVDPVGFGALAALLGMDVIDANGQKWRGKMTWERLSE